jgi:serine/threonine protein phosphatase 1
MPGRVISIGDIHGCSKPLEVIVNAIDLQSDDTLITLGDYVDRGPDTKRVLDQLLVLSRRCHLVPILGNHDEMMLEARPGTQEYEEWLLSGGDKTLDSYGPKRLLSDVPDAHFRFLENCVRSFETETHFFVHANYDPGLAIDLQNDATIRWLSLRVEVPGPHISGKIAVVGHSPQKEVLDLGHLICLDTGCCYGRWLTAMDIGSGQVWQADAQGRLRVAA